MRYVCLSVTMMFTMISPRVKKRFPTLDHFVEAGLLQTSEKEIISVLDNKFPKYSKHWLVHLISPRLIIYLDIRDQSIQ